MYWSCFLKINFKTPQEKSIIFPNCIIQTEKSYFFNLGKGEGLDLSIYFLKSAYFCVLHPILGKRKLIFKIFVFQLTLVGSVSKYHYIRTLCVFDPTESFRDNWNFCDFRVHRTVPTNGCTMPCRTTLQYQIFCGEKHVRRCCVETVTFEFIVETCLSFMVREPVLLEKDK